MCASVTESLQWTFVIPLPVIMELDGLAANVSPLGEAASAALEYITPHARSHSIYLANLNVRTEQVNVTEDEPS